MGKRVLVIGSGGREHALVWKLNQSPLVEKIYAAPGNPGIGALAACVAIEVNDLDGLLAFALKEGIDLTVVGPEVPIMAGLVDRFREAGLDIFGPTAAAAQIEASKAFAKQLFQKYHIPTARFQVFDQIEPARNYARTFTDQGQKVVIKADGLAAGKGVVIAATQKEAEAALKNMLLKHSFGTAGLKVVVEECLEGEEVSFFVICNGSDYINLMSAQDHKRVFDGDEGPNTGGMGAYVNPPIFTQELQRQVEDEIIRPVINALAQEGVPYQGVLYAGLMVTAAGPKVLEFNARFGDPETQVLMPMLKSDLYLLLEVAGKGEPFGHKMVECYEGSCLGVVLASGGYPGAFDKGQVIQGLEKVDGNTLLFHAGTKYENDHLVTDGGRVMAVVCRGPNLQVAAQEAYKQIQCIKFNHMHYRKDIGKRAWN